MDVNKTRSNFLDWVVSCLSMSRGGVFEYI